MQIDNTIYCNVCNTSNKQSPKAVFIKAIKGDEEIHVCTGCIPQIIHGSGEVAKTNECVKKAISN